MGVLGEEEVLKQLQHCIAAVLAAATVGCATQATAPTGRGDILIDGKGVHPESITSSRDGTVFTGSVPGIIYRAGPRDTVAVPFITPNAENGIRSLLGVLADDASGRLWVCSVANSFGPRTPGPQAPSEVVAFELASGKLVGRWPFPAPGGTCNDLDVAPDGSVYATDTPGGRILKLARGGQGLEVVVTDDRLKGIDGLAFGADGALYVNNVQTHTLWRVRLSAGGAEISPLTASRKMEGPDGLRHIGGNRFLQAEGGSGRITLVTIEGDQARIDVLREGLDSSPGVTRVGDTAYAIEGKIQYLFNPEFRGKDPGPFRAIAIPLPH